MLQGLRDMKTHMSRLERDRAALAAKKAMGQVSPAVQSRAPGYMRQTAASVAMKRVHCCRLCMLSDGAGVCHAMFRVDCQLPGKSECALRVLTGTVRD